MSEHPTALSAIEAKLDALLRQFEAGPQRWLSIESAAAYLDVSTKSIRRLISAGKLRPHRPTRGKILVDRHALDALVASSTSKPRKSRGANLHQ